MPRSKKHNGTTRFLENTIITSFIVAIIPFLLLCLYAQPNGDDFCFALLRKQHGFWGAQIALYNSAVGRYFYSFLVSFITLSKSNILAYKITAFFIIMFLPIVTYIFLQIFVKEISARKERLLCSLGICYLFVSRIPSTGDMYWSGAFLQYFFPTLLTFLVFCILKIVGDVYSPFRRFFLSFTAIVCTVMIVGSNETSMVLFGFTLLWSLFFIKNIQKSQRILLFILLLISFFCSLIVIIAPGNYIRSAGMHSNLFLNAIKGLVACSYTQFMHFNSWSNLVFVSIFLGFGFIVYKGHDLSAMTYQSSLPQKKIVLTFGLLVVLFSVLPAGAIYGSPGPTRTNAVAYLNFLFLLLLAIRICAVYAKRKLSSRQTLFDMRISKWVNTYKLALFVFIFCTVVFQENVVEAYKDLGMGKAKYFDNAMYKAFQDAYHQRDKGIKNIILDPIPVTKNPRSIGEYLSTDPTRYDNMGLAKWLGVESIRVGP